MPAIRSSLLLLACLASSASNVAARSPGLGQWDQRLMMRDPSHKRLPDTLPRNHVSLERTSAPIASPVATAAAALRVSGGAAPAAEAAEFRKSVFVVVFWFLAACAFGAGVIVTQGSERGFEFFAGYLVEQSLSIDNLFVFIMLFDYFKVPIALQKRALDWGIIGAVLMRGVMIFAGVAAIERCKGIMLVFAAILLASSFKLLAEGQEEEQDVAENMMVKIASRLCNAVDKFDGDKFFTVVNGVRRATPLLLCVVCIELSDFVFAVDSIPAVLAISKNPLIVYSSNIFAIACLRALYVLTASAIANLVYLRPAVALILGFVGGKMIAEYFHVHIPTATSLAVVVSLLSGGVGLSLLEQRLKHGSKR